MKDMMRRLWKATPLLTLLAILAASVPASADVVTDWNGRSIDAIRTSMASPMRDALVLATVHAAIFEAVNAIDGDYHIYRSLLPDAKGASREAAAAGAAHRVLTSLFPNQAASLDALLAESLAAEPDAAAAQLGVVLGQVAADEIVAWRSTDGSMTMTPYTPGGQPGDWVPTPPGFMMPMFPGWGAVTPFAIPDGAAFRPAPPPEMTSALYVEEFQRTRSLGAKESALRSMEQTNIARFWTDNPVQRWNLVAQQAAAQFAGTVVEHARLFALLNIAMNDAQIAAWDAKYTYNRWRPITAIRAADTDGNALTDPDPAWEPLLMTPAHPEYVSGHSTVSGAAAEVLATFFGTDEVAFTVEPSQAVMMPAMGAAMTMQMPLQPRTFSSFSSAASEIGISRIYGGIHFDLSNTNGSALGMGIGAFVSDNLLLDNAPPETPLLVAPADGAVNVGHSPATLEWSRCLDPDDGDALTYVVEYTADGSLAGWTVAETDTDASPESDFALGTGGIAFIGSLLLAGRDRRKRWMLALLLVAFACAPLVSCGGDAESGTVPDTMSQPVALEASTTYWWRVTAVDSNGKASVSTVSSFTTAP